MHPTKDKEVAMLNLLHYISFAAIDGVLTAVDDEDAREDMVKELCLTTVPQRQPTHFVLRFRQSGSHKYIHSGDNFAFLGDLNSTMIDARIAFRRQPKVRVMDTHWIYQRALIETKYSSNTAAIIAGYALSLFNCLVGHQLPLQLLITAIQREDAESVAYLTDELPKCHLDILKRLIRELAGIEITAVEIGSPLHQLKMSYNPLGSYSSFTAYHESFENIVSVRLKAIQEKVLHAAKEAEIKSCISRLEASALAAKAEVEAARELDNDAMYEKKCSRLYEIALLLNQQREKREQLEANHREVLQRYKLEEDNAYYI
jgi:hypothetical protein